MRLALGAVVMVAGSSTAKAGANEWTATRAAAKKKRPAIVQIKAASTRMKGERTTDESAHNKMILTERARFLGSLGRHPYIWVIFGIWPDWVNIPQTAQNKWGDHRM